ncbi:MAG TPA: sugar phosphate isomerase/epimerase family protein [Gemmatimonadaceae bacterium]|nr:sugar phosphate isomerase/epimerase family protein [Gemmatimonadaceae bacterium]
MMSVPRMQLGVSTWVWTSPATTAVLETLVPHIAALGFDVIELPIEEVGQFDVARAGELAREHGLEVSVCAVIGPGRDLLLDDEAERGVSYLQSCIDVARELGSPTVAGPFYSAVGRCWRSTDAERERDVDRIARVLHSLGEYAADRGVTLGVETLNRFETSFLNTTSQALELIRRVDHPSVGLTLDLFHLGIEEKHIGDALRAAGRHLVHVQVAENDRGTPGTGHLPWPDVAAALHEIGYAGRVVIETFSDRVEAIARAAAIWRPLAPNSDTLAREGLAFLRGLLAPVPLLAVQH